MFKQKMLFAATFLMCISLSGCKAEEIIPPVTPPVVQKDVDVYVTTANKSMLFVPVPLAFSTKPNMAVENHYHETY